MSRDESIVDDASSVGNKDDDDDDEEDGNDDEKFEGFSGDPERLKAFNVSIAEHAELIGSPYLGPGHDNVLSVYS